LLSVKVEVDNVFLFVRSIANDAIFNLRTDLFKGFSRQNMSTGPQCNKLIEPIILQFGYWANEIIKTILRGSFYDDFFNIRQLSNVGMLAGEGFFE
jgi:hypothetical protein